MFKLRNFTLLSTRWANFKFEACYRSQKSYHGDNKGLQKQKKIVNIQLGEHLATKLIDISSVTLLAIKGMS